MQEIQLFPFAERVPNRGTIPGRKPLFTVSQNSENSLFNGVGKIGKFQPPPGVFLFLRPCCPGQVLSCPGPGIVGKTSTRGPWGRFPSVARVGFSALPGLVLGCPGPGIVGKTSTRVFCTRVSETGGVVLQSGRLRDFAPPPPRRVCRFRRGCCPQHLREPGTNPPIFPVQEHGTRREK